MLEFSGLEIIFRCECEGTIASLSLSNERIQKLVATADEMRGQEGASLAPLRKLAGKLRFAQRTVMGRSGRSSLEAIYKLIAGGRGFF